MARNMAHDALIDRRRQRVADLLARRRTQREICDMLATEGFTNPDTGEPYSLGTVNADVQALKKNWRREAAQAVADHVADILAELDAVRRKAWADGDLLIVLRALETKVDLLGIGKRAAEADVPVKIAIVRVESRKTPPVLPAFTG